MRIKIIHQIIKNKTKQNQNLNFLKNNSFFKIQ